MKAIRLPAGIAIPHTDITISRSVSVYHLFATRVIAHAKIGNEQEIKVWPIIRGKNEFPNTNSDLIHAPARNKMLAIRIGQSSVILLNIYIARNVIGT